MAKVGVNSTMMNVSTKTLSLADAEKKIRRQRFGTTFRKGVTGVLALALVGGGGTYFLLGRDSGEPGVLPTTADVRSGAFGVLIDGWSGVTLGENIAWKSANPGTEETPTADDVTPTEESVTEVDPQSSSTPEPSPTGTALGAVAKQVSFKAASTPSPTNTADDGEAGPGGPVVPIDQGGGDIGTGPGGVYTNPVTAPSNDPSTPPTDPGNPDPGTPTSGPGGITVIPGDGGSTSGGVTTYKDGSTVLTDWSVTYADGSKWFPDGSVLLADGTRRLADGTKVQADGSVVDGDGNTLDLGMSGWQRTKLVTLNATDLQRLLNDNPDVVKIALTRVSGGSWACTAKGCTQGNKIYTAEDLVDVKSLPSTGASLKAWGVKGLLEVAIIRPTTGSTAYLLQDSTQAGFPDGNGKVAGVAITPLSISNQYKGTKNGLTLVASAFGKTFFPSEVSSVNYTAGRSEGAVSEEVVSKEVGRSGGPTIFSRGLAYGEDLAEVFNSEALTVLSSPGLGCGGTLCVPKALDSADFTALAPVKVEPVKVCGANAAKTMSGGSWSINVGTGGLPLVPVLKNGKVQLLTLESVTHVKAVVLVTTRAGDSVPVDLAYDMSGNIPTSVGKVRVGNC